MELEDFRKLGADFQMLRPFVDRNFTVWDLLFRLAQSGDWHDWRLRVRLGRNAAGSWAQRATSPAPAPPGGMRAAIREATEVLRAGGQVGYSRSFTADAQLGYLVMANPKRGFPLWVA